MEELIQKKIFSIIRKSERSLKIAINLKEQGEFDFACSRAYYSVFYLLEALLLTKDLEFSKHSSVLGAFNKNFIHTDNFNLLESKRLNYKLS